jgi:hypothetical protein
MNRRDAALLAHLDAIEDRISAGFAQLGAKLELVRDDIAGLKLELATHRHEDS